MATGNKLFNRKIAQTGILYCDHLQNFLCTVNNFLNVRRQKLKKIRKNNFKSVRMMRSIFKLVNLTGFLRSVLKEFYD